MNIVKKNKDSWNGITLCRKKVDPKNYDRNVTRKTAIVDQISQLTNLRMKL